MSAATEFEAVIGLEVHCQLATETKIFCACPARPPAGQSVADVRPNAHSCPVCAGHPGTLPVLNRRVVEYAIRAGLATNCEINPASIFARKNYFYPDLPKGYQLSQYDQPICRNGWLTIETAGGGARRIPIERIHMEEDAGKSVHAGDHSLVNLNRAGVPLIEIVTGPDLRSAAEAGAYLRALHAIVTYAGITDGNMQEGNFRCDANVSVRPRGAAALGTRAEIKNVNSFRFVEKAIDYEIARQSELVRGGGRVVQETRLYDSARNATASMRSKEEAMDYRYFPDPDLQSVQVSAAWVEEIRATLPELPEQRRARYLAELGLNAADAASITATRAMSDFFEESVKQGAQAKQAANLITGEIARLLNEAPPAEDSEVSASPGVAGAHASSGSSVVTESSKGGGGAGTWGRLTPAHVAAVSKLVLAGEISSTGAKQILASAFATGESAARIVEQQGLRQVSDLGALVPLVERILAAHPSQVADFKAGKEKILGFLTGQVMKESGGKANPGLIQEMIRKKLHG